MKNVAYVYHPDYLLHAPPSSTRNPRTASSRSTGISSASDSSRRWASPRNTRTTEKSCAFTTPVPPEAGNVVPAGGLTLDTEDTYLNKNSYLIALLSAAGAIAGAEAVATGKVDRAFCAVRPPGTTPRRNEGMGFCLLNNAAITARYLQARHGVSKVMIIDWDVHHGNGTQSIFSRTRRCSSSASTRTPPSSTPGRGGGGRRGRGRGGDDPQRPDGAGRGDEEYRQTFEQMLAPAADTFRPEFLVLSAGFDAHRDDPMADIELTEEGFRFLSRFAVELANRYCGGKIVSILEGGYETESLTQLHGNPHPGTAEGLTPGNTEDALMFVTRRMQRDVATISASASLQEARRLMRGQNVRQLPVTGEGNKLVGILSDRDIREATLPVGLLPGSSEKEMEEMLASTPVEKVMTRKVVTATVNDSLEDAIVLLHDFRVNALPVVDDKGTVVGIITRTDVLKAFIEALGVGEISSRLEVVVPDVPGALAGIVSIIKTFHVNITSVLTTGHTEPQNRAVFFRIATLNVGPIRKALEEAGYRILNPEDFRS